jgi:hypothetical protein
MLAKTSRAFLIFSFFLRATTLNAWRPWDYSFLVFYDYVIGTISTVTNWKGKTEQQ